MSEEINEPTVTDDEITEAEAQEAKEPEEKPDYEQVATEAFLAAVAAAENNDGSLTGEPLKALQEAFRSIPSAARAKAQGAALKAVIAAGGIDLMEVLLDATQNLPKSVSGGTRARKQVDPKVALTIQAAGILVAFADVTSDPEIGAEVASLAKTWYTEGAPDDQKEAVLRAAAGAIKGSGSRGRGGSGGNRNAFTDTLADVIGSHPELVGAELTFPKPDGWEGTVTLTAEGAINVNGKDFTSPTGASKEIRGPEASATNGWDFFTVAGEGGKKLGSYRNA